MDKISINTNMISLIVGALALLGTFINFIYAPYTANSVQAEQITTLKEDITSLKVAVPQIQQSLARIEGKLDSVNKP